jgi:hypothetical protein
MRRRQYHLRIPKPCEENWHEMPGNEKERHCGVCSKTVPDFTKLTSDQILQKIKETRGQVCGSFTKAQLQQVYTDPVSPGGTFIYKRMLAGLMLFIQPSAVTASEYKAPRFEIASDAYREIELRDSDNEFNTNPTDSLRNVIQGQVLEEGTNEPLSFINVSIQGMQIGTSTDMNGRFRLTIPGTLHSGKFTLIISSLGYKELIFTLNSSDLPILDKTIILSEAHSNLVGEFIIIEKNAGGNFGVSSANFAPGIVAQSPEYAGLGNCQARRLTEEAPASRQIPLTRRQGFEAIARCRLFILFLEKNADCVVLYTGWRQALNKQ